MSPMAEEWSRLPELLQQVGHTVGEFTGSLQARAPACVDAPELPAAGLPETGSGSEAALAQFAQQLLPHLSGSAGPRYWGFVTGGVTPAAILGDWLASATDQNLSTAGDSIATAVEVQVLGWLRQLFLLPEGFAGSLTSGATGANLLGLLCGRQFAGRMQGIDIAAKGMRGARVEVFAACAHASSLKGLAMAGLGREQLVEVDCEHDSERMCTAALSRALAASASPGKIVIASAGTVTGTDFDDLDVIAELCRAHNAWLHVDAAFGLFSRLLEEKRHWTGGIELADSITSDCHKWLNVPYDSGVFLTRHVDLLEEVLAVPSPYLASDSLLPNFMNRAVENSRRFRALPLWFVLQAYGRDGAAQIVADNCRQAATLANWLATSPDYQLLTPCKLNVVVFRPQQCADLSVWLKRLNASGEVFMTAGQWQGRAAVRAAFSNWSTTVTDVERAIALLEKKARPGGRA